MGHLKNYAVGDAVAHYQRRMGLRVLHPMGYDAFGLPAENHAIRTRRAPPRLERELDRGLPARVPLLGRVVRLVARDRDPRARLLPLDPVDIPQALRARAGLSLGAAVNWCPKDQTVLANEQVIDGRCERCGTLVEARQLEQWFFRITDYADRLLDDLDTVEWPAHVVRMQRNWIGRSEGAEVTFAARRDGRRLPGLHHPPGHAVRRDVLRHGARAPRRAAAGRGHRARGGRPRVRQPRADGEPRGPRGRRPREDRRAARPHRHQPGQRRAASPCGWPTTC